MSTRQKKITNLGSLDLFGIRPMMKIGGQSRGYSIFGLGLTFIVAAMSILLFIFFGWEIVAHEKPRLSRSEVNGASNDEFFEVGANGFNFALGVADTV
jgi:hypothetical protein